MTEFVDLPEEQLAPPLTEDQVELIAHHVDRGVRKGVKDALRKYRNGALVGYVILLLGIGGVYTIGQHDQSASRANIVNSGRVVAVEGCNRDFKTNVAFRDGVIQRLIDVQERNYKAGTITKAQRDEGVSLYQGLQAQIPVPDCRNADDTLTDSPDANISVPAGLHKGR